MGTLLVMTDHVSNLRLVPGMTWCHMSWLHTLGSPDNPGSSSCCAVGCSTAVVVVAAGQQHMESDTEHFSGRLKGPGLEHSSRSCNQLDMC